MMMQQTCKQCHKVFTDEIRTHGLCPACQRQVPKPDLGVPTIPKTFLFPIPAQRQQTPPSMHQQTPIAYKDVPKQSMDPYSEGWNSGRADLLQRIIAKIDGLCEEVCTDECFESSDGCYLMGLRAELRTFQ